MKETKRERIGRRLAVVSSVCRTGMIIGLCGVIAGRTWGLFVWPSSVAFGDVRPDEFAGVFQAMGLALYSKVVILVSGFTGLVCAGISLWGCHYRAPWFFRVLVWMALLLILTVPLGTVIGGALLVYVLMHRSQFHVPQSKPQQDDER